MTGYCLDEDDVRALLSGFFARCRLASLCGVALQDVVDGGGDPPRGWVYDFETRYYLPPTVNLDEMLEKGAKLIN